MEIIEWISEWFASNCDGDWEHENQIKIYTVDNPGWVVRIDLRNTRLENLELDYSLVENDENDWYGISIENAIFDGSGDLSKLFFLLSKFKEIAEAR